MRYLLLLVLVGMTACGSGAARTAVESPAPDPEPVVEATPDTTPAVGTDLTDGEREALESFVRAQIGEVLDVESPRIRIELLGALEVTGGHAAALRVHAVDGFGMGEQILLVILTPQGDTHLGHAIDIGIARSVPGAEDILRLESVEGLRLDHGVIRAEVSIVSGSAEFATCSDCQQRIEYPTIRQGASVVCGGADPLGDDGCALIPTSAEIVSPGEQYDENGELSPLDDPDPPEYEMRLDVLDRDTIRLSLVSGALPPDQDDALGDVPIANYDMSRMLYPDED